MTEQPQSTPHLVMRQGPNPNRVFTLQKNIITIGRAADNDIVIDDEQVSRYHARLTRLESGWVIEDLGSSYGVFINGQRIQGPTLLAPGSLMDIGIAATFSLEGGAPLPIQAPVSRRPKVQPPIPRKVSKRWPLLLGIGGLALLGLVVLAGGAILAYFYLFPSSDSLLPASVLPTTPGPEVILLEPAPGFQLAKDATFMVHAIARHTKGVTHIELWVDDLRVVQQDSPDLNGLNPFSLVQEMTAVTPGTHALLARAYNSQGEMGESLIQYITVLDQAAIQGPELVQYIVQPGDTLENIARIANSTVQAIQQANPGLGKNPQPGRPVFAPAQFIPHPPLPKPGPDPSRMGALVPQQDNLPVHKPQGLLQPGVAQILPDLLPDQKQVFLPSKASIKPPTSLKAEEIKDCKVKLTWEDQSDNETGFNVYRVKKPSSIQSQAVVTRGANQRDWTDTVPGPGSYGYAVAAVQATNLVKNEAMSGYVWVDVPASPLCRPVPTFKQVIFQPLTVMPTSGSFDVGWLNVTIGSNIAMRVPAGQQHYTPFGDYSHLKLTSPAPESVFLNPEEAIKLEVEANGTTNANLNPSNPQPPTPLGVFAASHTYAELTASDRQSKLYTGKGSGFSLVYKIWLEDWQWTGQGTNPLMRSPDNLRITGVTSSQRSLAWDYYDQDYKKEYMNGFILYRKYVCPGEDTQFKSPRALPKDPQTTAVSLSEEPDGCACLYQVSIFGTPGESPPSDPPKEECKTTKPVATLDVNFVSLEISPMALPTASSAKIVLFANNYSRVSDLLLLQAKTHQLSEITLNSKPNNNQLLVNVGENQSLQLGYYVTGVCRSADMVVRQFTNWEGYSETFELVSSNNQCKLTVEVNDRAGGPVGFPGETAPALLGFGENCIRDDACISGFCQLDKCVPPGNGKTGEYCHTDENCESKVCQCPNGWDGTVCRGYQDFDSKTHGVCTTGANNGDSCKGAQGVDWHAKCASGYCANGKCAPPEGTGKPGDYCHHNAQCKNFFCFCKNGYDGDFCKGWQDFTSESGKHGVCANFPGVQNGYSCWRKEECISKNCAETICAPLDFTGKSGEYCHHNNHCASTKCSCPAGTDLFGFCNGWREEIALRGTCAP